MALLHQEVDLHRAVALIEAARLAQVGSRLECTCLAVVVESNVFWHHLFQTTGKEKTGKVL